MKQVLVGLLLGVLIGENAWAEKRLPRLMDLYKIYEVGEPNISPDGQWVVYSVSGINKDKNETFSDIWRVSITNKKEQQLTFSGLNSNTLPRFSPDGRWIAFLSNAADNENTQIVLMSSTGKNPIQLTHFKGAISDFIWSPDSKQLAFIGAEEQANIRDKNDQPIVVDRFVFKSDDKGGYQTNKKQHLYLFTLKSKTTTLLTPGHYDEFSPVWSPNGKYIAYVTKRGKDPDRNFNFDIYLIEPKRDAKERQLTQYIGSDGSPDWGSKLSWSPDSSKIAYLRSEAHKWLYYAPTQLAVVDIDTTIEKRVVNLDRWIYKPQWSSDGKSIYMLIEQSRTIYLNQMNVHTGKMEQLTSGQRSDVDFTVNKKHIVLLSSDDQHPNELFLVDPTLTSLTPLTPLTHQNQKLLNEVQFQPTEDIEFQSFDKTIIHGFLMKPPQYESGKKYSTLLYLHGGPVDQFDHRFDFSMQWLAAKGFLIVQPNPRGSSGRGFDFAKAIYADWGNKDVKDSLAAIDYVVSQGIADPNLLAVGGWSYGGILTDYIIASDTRFKAALSGAGTANILGNYGVDQYTQEYELELGQPWKKPELYLKLSYPFFKADSIKTATLFMCAQFDVNIPCSGSEQLYQALKSLNIPTQLIIYPKQNHHVELPSFQIDLLNRYVNWLNRYLK